MSLFQSICGFVLCAGVIVYAGTRLSFYGNRIAEITGLGKAWIGLVLMAAVTSLPELITGISSVAVVKAPNLAAGDVFGSCVFNLLILSILDALHKRPITSAVRSTHVFAASCGIILVTLSGAGLLLSDQLPDLGWISSITPLIFLVYFFSVWLMYRFENRIESHLPKPNRTDDARGGLLQSTILHYAFHALVVVGAALFLPYFGKLIAEQSGIGTTFFGTVFLAATTSLPELVVSVAALRMGSLDMAVGNLFGSNVFNMFILGADDLFYLKGSLYRDIDRSHLLSVLAVIAMTAVAVIGLLFRVKKKRFFLAADTFVILLLYMALMLLLYRSA